MVEAKEKITPQGDFILVISSLIILLSCWKKFIEPSGLHLVRSEQGGKEHRPESEV